MFGLGQLFSADDFPPRWSCGEGWTTALGLTHIVSDVIAWLAFMTIPLVLITLAVRRRDFPLPKLIWLFAVLFVACGFVHLQEALMFWWPVYRFSALLKVVMAACRCPSLGIATCDANLDTSTMMSTLPSSTIQCDAPIIDW